MRSPTPSILIVEDEAVIAMEIAAGLRQLGYKVAGRAANGDKALDLLASLKPDLVLLDIEIKGTLSGIDLARVIRRKYNFPFVFLTAFSDPMTLNSLRDTLPYGYIVKPFNQRELYTNIELALDKFAAEQLPSFPTQNTLNNLLPEPLTEREYETLRLLDAGLSYAEIGKRLYLSLNTVKTYQKSLFAKMDVNSRHRVSIRLRELINL